MHAALILLTLQGLLGALDNLWHHEWRGRLPSRPSARRELILHAVRSAIYAPVFLTFGWFAWQGWLAWVFAALLVAELGVTLLDFVEEDRSRLLPASERVLHTVLAVSYGAFLASLAPELMLWASAKSGIVLVERGAWSWVMSVYAAGALGWALRDAAAAWRLATPALATWQRQQFQIRRCLDARNVLVTGATGFIGRALCRRLIEQGHRVIVLARDRSRALDLFGPYCDIVESLDEIRSSRRIEAVINLAGAPIAKRRWTSARKAVLVESRVGTTRALVNWMRARGSPPAVLVSASAVGWYGSSPTGICTEDSPAGEDFPAALCRAWEREASSAHALGVRVVVLRLGLVLGPGGLLSQLLPTFRLALGTTLGAGTQPMPWIHIEDVLRVLERAMSDAAWRGAINAVAPQPVDNRGFSTALARTLSRPLWIKVPARLLRLALGEMSLLLLEGQRVAPVHLAELGYVFRFANLKDALYDLLPSGDSATNWTSVRHIG